MCAWRVEHVHKLPRGLGFTDPAAIQQPLHARAGTQRTQGDAHTRAPTRAELQHAVDGLGRRMAEQCLDFHRGKCQFGAALK